MTSLAKQLQRLAVPQASTLFSDDKRQASLIFDPKEAANLDKETIFALALSGLEQLENLEPDFCEFEKTLFNQSSQAWERGLQTKSVNAQLDQTIGEFLIRVSPYFLLKACHKTLEWLIYRYHIHQYNVDEIMASILPYHESKIFIRLIQLLPISEKTNKWHWMHASAKSGVPVPRSTIVNQCIKNTGLLSFLCDIVPKHIKVHGVNSRNLQAVLAFSCCIQLSVTGNPDNITENIVSVLIPSIIAGLKSSNIDNKAATYMIVSQLAVQSKLKTEFIEALLPLLTKNLSLKLAQEGLVCLLLVIQKQDIKKLPRRCFRHLCHLPGFIALLSSLNAQYQISPLLQLIVERLVTLAVKQSPYAQSDGDSGTESSLGPLDYGSILQGLLLDLQLESHVAETVSKLLLLDLMSAATVIGGNENWKPVAAMFLGILDRKYPDALDVATQNILSECRESDEDRKALQTVLSMSSCSSKYKTLGSTSTTLILGLSHAKSTMRLMAVQQIGDAIAEQAALPDGIPPAALLDRLNDDKRDVVQAMLDRSQMFPTLADHKVLGSALLDLLEKRSHGKWLPIVIPKVIDILLSDQEYIGVIPELEILLVPYILMGISDEKLLPSMISVLERISQSADLPLLSPFMKDIRKTFHKKGKSKPEVPEIEKLIYTLLNGVAAGLKSAPEKVDALMNKAMASPMNTVISLVVLSFMLESVREIPVGFKILTIVQQVDSTTIQKCKLNVDEESIEKLLSKWLTTASHAPYQIPSSCLLWSVGTISKYLKKEVLTLQGCKWWNFQDFSLEHLTLRTFETMMNSACGKTSKSISKAWQATLDGFIKTTLGVEQSYTFLASVILNGFNKYARQASVCAQVGSLFIICKLFTDASSMAEIRRNLQPDSPVLTSLCFALIHEQPIMRSTAMKSLEIAKERLSKNMGPLASLIKKIVRCKEEITADHQYLTHTVGAVFNKEIGDDHSPQSKSDGLKALLNMLVADGTPIRIKERWLYCLKECSNEVVLEDFVLMAKDIVSAIDDSESNEMEQDGDVSLQQGNINIYHIDLVQHVLNRFDVGVASGMDDKENQMYKLLVNLLQNYDAIDLKSSDGSTMTTIALHQISKHFFRGLGNITIQRGVVSALLDVATGSEDVDIVQAAQKSLRRIKLNAEHLQSELTVVLPENATVKVRRKTRDSHIGAAPVPWSRISTILEVLQTRTQCADTQDMVTLLFAVLTRLQQEESGEDVEYMKRLTLTCLYGFTSNWTEESVKPAQESMMLESLVACVRDMSNPQTQQQALMVMDSIASYYPDYILHNVMSIFTFVGGGLLQQDDSHSLQLIQHTIRTIVPALLKAQQKATEQSLEELVVSILTVFVDARHAVPKHRCLLVLQTLLETLGVANYMWLTLVLIIAGSIQQQRGGSANDSAEVHESEFKDENGREQDLTLASNLCDKFPASTQLKTLTEFLNFLTKLTDKHQYAVGMEKSNRRPRTKGSEKISGIDLSSLTPQKLRLFQFQLTKLIPAILSKESFIIQVVDKMRAPDNDDSMMDTSDDSHNFEAFLQVELLYLTKVAKCCGSQSQHGTGKFWKALLNQAHEVLEKINYLLPTLTLLRVVTSLTQHELVSVRRKALDLLCSKLQQLQQVNLSSDEVNTLLELIPIPVRLAKDGLETEDNDAVACCQVALFSLKLLCKILASSYPKEFTLLFDVSITVMQSKNVPHPVLSSSLLLLAELCSALKPHAIPHLKDFVPVLLGILQNSQLIESHELILTCAMTALHRLVISLPHFLSPYLKVILLVICETSYKYPEPEESGKKTQAMARLNLVRQNIASSIPPRILIPSMVECLNELQLHNQNALKCLMWLCQDHVSQISKEDLLGQQGSLFGFFSKALDVRNFIPLKLNEEEICESEDSIIQAFLALVVRLSETAFRPMFYKLYDWACREDTQPSRYRKLVFFKLCHRLAMRLKGLFNLFVKHSLSTMCSILSTVNTMNANTAGNYFGSSKMSEKNVCELLTSILGCLETCMLYDTEGLFQKEVFNMLLQPLVDQIENMIGGDSVFEVRITKSVAPCISQFAIASREDSAWKSLNYQVLLKARHNSPRVRFAALQVIEAIVKKLEDDYMIILPETIPYLAELMEDESEEVEEKCKNVISNMEEVLGESLQKYF